MPQKTNQTLNLPRPLVNKILAHAQQSTDGQSTCVSCGLISVDTSNNKFYHPIRELTDTSHCFSNTHAAFQQTLEHISCKQHTIFAYVFTAPENTNTPDENLFIVDKHYYIMISLDTKGVLSMQGFYREGKDLRTVELTLDL